MKRLFCWLIVVLSVIGCSPLNVSVSSTENLPKDYLSDEFTIVLRYENSPIRKNENIDLIIEVIEDVEIDFAPDYSSETYQFIENEWIKIEQVPMKTYGQDFLLTRANGDRSKLGFTTLIPILQGDDETIPLRIFIFGNLVENGVVTDNLAGAYIDIIVLNQ